MRKLFAFLLLAFAALAYAGAGAQIAALHQLNRLQAESVLRLANLGKVRDSAAIARAVKTLAAIGEMPAAVLAADLNLVTKTKAIPPGPSGLTASQAVQQFLGSAHSNYPVYLYGSSSGWQAIVQKAINTASAAGGGNVYVPGVNIPLTSSLTPASNVHVIGACPNFNWATGTQIPDAQIVRQTGTWFYSTSATFPAIAYNDVDRVQWGFFIQATTSTTAQNVWNTSGLTNGGQILLMTNQMTPASQATVSTVNTHQSITLSANASASVNENYLLPQGTVSSGSGTTWVMSAGSLANVSPYDVIVDGNTLNQGTVSSVNTSTNTVTFTGSVSMSTSGNWYLIVHPSTPANSTWINQGLVNFSAENCGFDTFTQAVQVGGRDSPGMWYGGLRNLYAINCSSWGINLDNCQHIKVECLWLYNNSYDVGGTGQLRIAADNSSTFLPGNCSFKDVFCYSNYTYGCKGIVVECFQAGCGIGSQDFFHVQSNRYITPLGATACTTTNGNTTIALTNAGNYVWVGLPVILSNSSTSYTAATSFNSACVAGAVYMVTSVASNNFTVSPLRSASTGTSTGFTNPGVDIAANASGTIYLFSHGMPLIEMTGYGGAQIGPTKLDNIDIESQSAAGIYLENSVGIQVNIPKVGAPGYGQNFDTTFCLRNSWQCSLTSLQSCIFDMDGPSAGFPSFFAGTMGSSTFPGAVQYYPFGMWYDAYNSQAAINLNASKGGNDIIERQANGYFTYPNNGMGLRVMGSSTLGSSQALNGSNCGLCIAHVASGSPTWNWTLPDATNSGTVNGYYTGLHYYIKNDLLTAGVLTLTTYSGQYFDAGTGSATNNEASLAYGAWIEVVAASNSTGSGSSGGTVEWYVIGQSPTGVTWSGMESAWVALGVCMVVGTLRRRIVARNNFAHAA